MAYDRGPNLNGLRERGEWMLQNNQGGLVQTTLLMTELVSVS